MISIENVSKTYRTRLGPRTILDGVNLQLERGQNIGILGRNGAGKSTLIRILSGAEQPTSGRIIRGMKVSWPLAFGGAFQPHFTGLDNLKFVCRIYGVDYRPKVAFVEEFTEPLRKQNLLAMALRHPTGSIRLIDGYPVVSLVPRSTTGYLL